MYENKIFSLYGKPKTYHDSTVRVQNQNMNQYIIRKIRKKGYKIQKINYDKKTVPYIVHTRETNKIEIKNV